MRWTKRLFLVVIFLSVSFFGAGHVRAGSYCYGSVVVDNFDCDETWQGGKVTKCDIKYAGSQATLTCDAACNTGGICSSNDTCSVNANQNGCDCSNSPTNCWVYCDENNWSACTVSCGGGTQTNDCGDTRDCNTQPCCDPDLWGACSVSCGAGTQTNDCGTTQACCIPCWGACSVSCGSGVQYDGCGGSQTCNTQPCPTPYPTVAISGNLKEYLRGSCYPNISTNTLSVNIVPQSPTSVTTNCGVTPPAGQTRSSYRCTAVFNNYSSVPGHIFPTPAQNLNLSASATSYSSAYWTNANACTATANNSLPVDVSSGGSTVYNKDIFFNNSSAWIKLKNSSFGSLGSLTNVLPLNIAAYDGDDDVLQRYFIINSVGNDPGLVTAQTINTGTAAVSIKGWKADSYTRATALTPSTFTQYVKSRKEHQIITNLSDLAEDKINLWQGNLTINNQANFNNKKVVLIVTGTVTLDMPNFQPANAALAILAQTINFTSSVNYAEGIFIAQTINTGSNTSQGLKIKGNLVAFSSFVNGREWPDNSQPSVFIVFDQEQYIDLLPYLSTANYEWRQIQ